MFSAHLQALSTTVYTQYLISFYTKETKETKNFSMRAETALEGIHCWCLQVCICPLFVSFVRFCSFLLSDPALSYGDSRATYIIGFLEQSA